MNRPIGIARPVALAALVLALACAPSRADIFRWVDDQGTLHFTDDPASIPAQKRDQHAVPIIKEPPKSSQPATEVPPASPAPAPAAEPSAPPSVYVPATGENGFESLQREIEQLKAKIEAKEALVRAVDEKRSLATNPLRNRIVSPADMELYAKYRVELPADRERLRQLESRLNRTP